MDVCSSNLTPYCHISLSCITDCVINANHQRSQPTPSHCAMCQYVVCHLLILLLLMPLVLNSNVGYLPPCVYKPTTLVQLT